MINDTACDNRPTTFINLHLNVILIKVKSNVETVIVRIIHTFASLHFRTYLAKATTKRVS